MNRYYQILIVVLISLLFTSSTIILFYYNKKDGDQFAASHYQFMDSYNQLEKLINHIPKNEFQFTRQDIVKIFNLDTTNLFPVEGIDSEISSGNLNFTFDPNGILKGIEMIPQRHTKEYLNTYYYGEGNGIITNNHFDNFLLMEKSLVKNFLQGGKLMWIVTPILILVIALLIRYSYIEFYSNEYSKFRSVLNIIYFITFICFVALFLSSYNIKISAEEFLSANHFIDPVVYFIGFDYALILPTFLLNTVLLMSVLFLFIKLRIKATGV